MSKNDDGFVAPPLPGYFDAQDRGEEWHLFWKRCGAGWALTKTSDNPGNLLRMAGPRPRPRREGDLVMSEAAERSPALEVEAGSIGKFLQLLELREGQRAHHGRRAAHGASLEAHHSREAQADERKEKKR